MVVQIYSFWSAALVTVMGEGGRMKQWLAAMETSVLVMGLLRLFSGSAEIFAALLMLYVNDAKKALFINGMLAFVGPTVLILTMTIGIASVASEFFFETLFSSAWNWLHFYRVVEISKPGIVGRS